MLARIAHWRQPGLYTIGICGAQGSGKTTLVAALAEQLALRGVKVATLSLDDLYLGREERQELARTIHPLFATRGVPGTHDPGLGLATVDALKRGEAAPLPRFDKASDDPLPRIEWPPAPPGTEVLLLEGWCLGATPQNEAALATPVNAFEREEDPDGTWRRHANARLAGDYQPLFAAVNRLILLAAPSWEVVAAWREQQEADLRMRGGSAVMTPEQIVRFIQHYERLTRHVLATMPDHADLTVRLDEGRAVRAID
ncbi:kinase [Novosphingobium kunmingense]|uniref:kinase n=1 Tax=Novosphingobium kunmingense TaxID=1211806 RepID=UPI0018E270D7|nr:kinase [Novosphingobium kunmingense]